MTSYPQRRRLDAETQFMEILRTRYEDKGFTFTTRPETANLPEFLGSYVPDALARRPGLNVAIQVKLRQSPSTERALKDIRRLFEGHSDWQFHVVFMGTDPLQSVTIPISAPATVRSRMSEIRALTSQGQFRPAFIMAWSLLEAAFRARNSEADSHPATAGAIVQALATNGYIEPDTEREMRDLIDLRNRLVHGDLVAEPTMADVELVLSAVEETLNADAV